jgi:hypothetical protein
MKLSEYAAAKQIPYHKAWRQFKRGEIKGSVNSEGNIEVSSVNGKTDMPLEVETKQMIPQMISGSTETRRNRAATIERTDKYSNIESGLLPYTRIGFSGSRSDRSTIFIQDAIILCQFAYCNVSVFKSTVDLLTEFSASNIFLRGGSKKSRNFFTQYFKKINLWGLQDKFFRELWRSGNVFLYRFDGKLTKKDINTITQVFGTEEVIPSEVELPLRYVVINPAEVRLDGTSMFTFGKYCKVLNPYEIELLRNPQTEEDKLIYDNLPEKIKNQIGRGKSYSVIEILMPLDPKYLSVVFNKKQDYESFSVPTFFPVLSDINIKEEYKKIDAAIARTMQQAVLLINMGYENKEGKYIVNTKAIEEMQTLFKNESVGRVLVCDFTTKAQFVIPQIADILNEDKYKVIENDIKIGLGNVLMAGSDQKFANQSISVQVFMERLRHARQAFIQDFLIKEMKRIAKQLNFKSCPEPFFEEIDLKDEIQMARIYTQLAQIGILTADEAIRAIDSGQLPTPEESLESQEAFKKSRENDLYKPLIGGQKEDVGMNGRPPGSKTPQSTKNVSPIGQSKAVNFSAKKVMELTSKVSELDELVSSKLLKKFKIKKLNEDQKNVSSGITDLILANETPDQWEKVVDSYVSSPIDKNEKRVNEVVEIAAKYGTTNRQAAILLSSVIE